MMPGRYFCAKMQLLGELNRFCASVSFRLLPSASIAYFLVGFVSVRNRLWGLGGYLLRFARRCSRKAQFPGQINHFCDSASSRKLPRPASLSLAVPHDTSHVGGVGLFTEAWVGSLRKLQFLGVFNHFRASVSSRHLPSASVDYILVEFVST